MTTRKTLIFWILFAAHSASVWADSMPVVFSTAQLGVRQFNLFDPVALNNLAVAKAKQGDLAGALNLLERAKKLTPKSEAVAENLQHLRDWIEYNDIRINDIDVMELGSSEQRLQQEVPPPPPALWDISLIH